VAFDIGPIRSYS